MSRPSLEAEPEARLILEWYAAAVEAYPENLRRYEEKVAKLWETEEGARLAELGRALKAARQTLDKAEVEKLTTQFQRAKRGIWRQLGLQPVQCRRAAGCSLPHGPMEGHHRGQAMG